MAKHITEEQIDLLVERLLNRVDKANVYFLKSIGAYIKKIKNLSPSKAQQLIQILKYGGDYEDIIRKLAKYTESNINDIDEIFNQYAKKDQMFYKQFYEHRNMPFVPYESNMLLLTQTKALANIVKNEMYNFTRNNVLGYTINGVFRPLREVYNELLDTAFLNVNQGKETFDSAMSGILKEIGGSGLKTLDYESGRSIRLDSAVRMHLRGRLRELHYENQRIIANEIQADGWEISVHENPAPDHEDIQGRQFRIEEYDKLQNGEIAKDYKGNTYTLDKNDNGSYRPIREMNCKHIEFSIILGVSKPEYTDEQLNQIINDNDKGFMLDGKHYTMYEGTQLQRSLEREIRKNKDIQILARESGNDELIAESQNKISILTSKYNELSDESGLPKKMDRLTVSKYHSVGKRVKNIREIEYARKNNQIWHSTENLEEIINTNKLMSPSISVAKKMTDKVKYGTQFIEFEPELLENVNKSTFLYKGDGGNKFTKEVSQFNSLIQMLKDNPKYYNELKFTNDLESIKYIKKVYIRQDEAKEIIKLLKDNKIKYQFYTDYRVRK